MKSYVKNLLSKLTIVMFALTLLITGCKKEDIDGEYSVQFSINKMSVEKPITKSTKGTLSLFEELSVNPEEVSHIRIGIDGTYDNPLISNLLTYDPTTDITEPIRLNKGNHNLVSIQLLKETGIDTYEVLYSGVQNGSYLSQFVMYTLPLQFYVPLLDDVAVPVDVVAIDDWTPAEFGWAMFNIGYSTINAVYFYGAMDDGTMSTMSMKVYKNETEIYSCTQEPEGWLKVLYPDVYSIDNAIEIYKFVLIKDGVEYVKEYTVAELLSLPREVILLNVYGSGMAGFAAWRIKNFTLMMDNGPDIIPAKYVVKKSDNTIIFDSGVKQNIVPVKYLDDYSNITYTIIITYSEYGSPGSPGPDVQKTAVVDVNTLNQYTDVYMNRGNNVWWLFN